MNVKVSDVLDDSVLSVSMYTEKRKIQIIVIQIMNSSIFQHIGETYINYILPCCPVLRPQITGTSELSAGVCVTTNVSAKHEPPIASGGASEGPTMSNS